MDPAQSVQLAKEAHEVLACDILFLCVMGVFTLAMCVGIAAIHPLSVWNQEPHE